MAMGHSRAMIIASATARHISLEECVFIINYPHIIVCLKARSELLLFKTVLTSVIYPAHKCLRFGNGI